jgi:hypothetical protein
MVLHEDGNLRLADPSIRDGKHQVGKLVFTGLEIQPRLNRSSSGLRGFYRGLPCRALKCQPGAPSSSQAACGRPLGERNAPPARDEEMTARPGHAFDVGPSAITVVLQPLDQRLTHPGPDERQDGRLRRRHESADGETPSNQPVLLNGSGRRFGTAM